MSERRPIIAANWKMQKTHLEAIRDVQKLSYLLEKSDSDRVEIVIIPPFTALRAVQILIDSDRLDYGLGAQNVHFEEKGAFSRGDLAADARRPEVLLRRRRSFGTPRDLRRDG